MARFYASPSDLQFLRNMATQAIKDRTAIVSVGCTAFTQKSGCRQFRWPPQAFCPECHSCEFDWEALGGIGTVSSFVVVHYCRFPKGHTVCHCPLTNGRHERWSYANQQRDRLPLAEHSGWNASAAGIRGRYPYNDARQIPPAVKFNSRP
jgi:hypothetical protein